MELEDNYITEIPDLNKLENLEVLNLATNEINTLDDNFFEGLSSLKKVKLDFNHFTSLPSSITQLENLEELHLNGNALTSFPDGFEKLTSLKKLFLKSSKKLTKEDISALHEKMGEGVVIYY